MTRTAILCCSGLAILVLTGLEHGRLTNRWETPDLDGPVARLAALPWVVGDWEGAQVDLDPAVQPDPAECRGQTRRYVQRGSGSAVTLHLACGLRTPTIIHSPDLCYPFQGYEATQDRQLHTLPAPGSDPAEFWVATYSKASAAVPHHLRLFWSWRGGAAWRAPQSPRFAFASHPRLYKLVVLRQLPGPVEALDDDPALEFLRAVLPEVEKVVAP